MDIDLDDFLGGDTVAKPAQPAPKFKPKGPLKKRPTAPPPTKAVSSSSSHAVQAVENTANTVSTESVRTPPTNPSEEIRSDVVPNDNGSASASKEKSVGENADKHVGLENLGDTEGAAPPPEATLVSASNPENSVRRLASPEQSANLDPLTAGDPIISTIDGCGHKDNDEIEREEMDVMDSTNISELTAKSEQKTGKFQPKPKKQQQAETCEASESVSCSLASQFVPPDISDLPTEETSEPHLNVESVNIMETAQMDSGVDVESLPPAKLVSRRAKVGPSIPHTPSDPSPDQQKASSSRQENETGRLLRPRKGKAKICGLVDEDDDEVLASGDFSEEHTKENENRDDEELQAEEEPKTKKVKRTKKPDNDKEKPARKRKKAGEASDKPADADKVKSSRKRKKAGEASDKPADAKPKRFPHSTRRRRVTKALLEANEDDGDYQNLPIRDLIILADYRERQAKKDEAAAAAAAPAPTRSNMNHSDPYNEDENPTSEQGEEYNDGETPVVEDSSIFNYQTYMVKTPIVKWSKQDTEVFYEAIRQFGTDLSMIQQLFPGRTRHQVKLKYKKEERQQPLRLREALTNRTKDRFHYKTVIERLKKMAAEKQNAEDDSIDLTGNDVEEGTEQADDEATNDEHKKEVENENVANDDTTQVGSPLKSDDDDEEEEDLSIWNLYKSDA